LLKWTSDAFNCAADNQSAPSCVLLTQSHTSPSEMHPKHFILTSLFKQECDVFSVVNIFC